MLSDNTNSHKSCNIEKHSSRSLSLVWRQVANGAMIPRQNIWNFRNVLLAILACESQTHRPLGSFWCRDIHEVLNTYSHTFFKFLVAGRSDIECLGTVTQMGYVLTAPDDRSVWCIRETAITGGKQKLGGKLAQCDLVQHKSTDYPEKPTTNHLRRHWLGVALVVCIIGTVRVFYILSSFNFVLFGQLVSSQFDITF